MQMRCRECPGCVGRGCQIIGKHAFWPIHGQCQSLQEFSGGSYCKTILRWTGFFFSILSVRDLWNFIYFGACFIGKWTSSGGELGTSIGRHSILILGSAKALNPATTWHERRHGGLRRRGKGLFSNNWTQGPQFTLTLDLCSVYESYSWCCPIPPKEEKQLIKLVRFPGCL